MHRMGDAVRSLTQEAFDALSDPTRRLILQFLSEDHEKTAGDIADQITSVGRTAISSHLRILRTSGLILERREGRYRYYSLDPEGPVRDALAFLQGILGSAIPTVAQETEPARPRDRRRTG
ncbi:metalloregulator ArsR/SmtB family transcription factor [Rhodococcus koreensis]